MPIITRTINFQTDVYTSSAQANNAAAKMLAQNIRDIFVNDFHWQEKSTDIDSATIGSSATVYYVTLSPPFHSNSSNKSTELCFKVTASGISGGTSLNKVSIRPFRDSYTIYLGSTVTSDNMYIGINLGQLQTLNSRYSVIDTFTFSFFNSDYCTYFLNNDKNETIFYIKDTIDFFSPSYDNLFLEGLSMISLNNRYTSITDAMLDVSSEDSSSFINNVTVPTTYHSLRNSQNRIICPQVLLYKNNKIQYLLQDNYFYMSDAQVGKFYNITDNLNNNWLCLCLMPNILVKIKNNSFAEEENND